MNTTDKTTPDPTPTPPQGWQCPICHNVMAPHVSSCPFCVQSWPPPRPWTPPYLPWTPVNPYGPDWIWRPWEGPTYIAQ